MGDRRVQQNARGLTAEEAVSLLSACASAGVVHLKWGELEVQFAAPTRPNPEPVISVVVPPDPEPLPANPEPLVADREERVEELMDELAMLAPDVHEDIVTARLVRGTSAKP